MTYQLTKCLARRLKGPVPTAEPRLRKLLVSDGRQHVTHFFLSVSIPPTGWWSEPAVSFDSTQMTKRCAYSLESGSPKPRAPPPPLAVCQGVHSVAWKQALTGPLRVDDLYSGDNLRLTFEARASWRLFLSHTLKQPSQQGSWTQP